MLKKINLYIFFIILLFFKKSFSSVDHILILSIPKCGTHLAAKAVELLTGKELATEVLPEQIIKYGISIISRKDKFFRCHLMYNHKIKIDLEKNNFKILFIYRDPRDQIISSAYWIQERLNSNKKLHNLTAEQLIDFQLKRLPMSYVSQYNTKDKIKLNPSNFNFSKMIDELILKVKEYYSLFLNWKYLNNVCVVQFENLVGKDGNGDDNLQRSEIKKICKHLNINSEAAIDHCIKNLFGGTNTFREGKIGGWRQEFTKKQIKQFKKINGDLLIKLGYEKDLSW